MIRLGGFLVVGVCAAFILLFVIAALMLRARNARRRLPSSESGWRGPLPRSREFVAARESLTEPAAGFDCMDCAEMMPCSCARAYARQSWTWTASPTTLWTVTRYPGPDLTQPEPEEPEPEPLSPAEAVAAIRDEAERRDALEEVKALLRSHGDGTAS